MLPLPEEGRPHDFNGAVGQFTVTARLEPAEVPAGEAAMLHVEVSGTSNIKAAPPPKLPDWPGVRVYPPSEEAEGSAILRSTHAGSRRCSTHVRPDASPTRARAAAASAFT